MGFKSDIEIAQECEMKPITEIAAKAGIADKYLEQYGKYKAKIDYNLLKETDKNDGKLILVTAINPTPAGEGKTTTTVGLADAMQKLGKNVMVALREPSLGPVFGVKGGAAGGGYAQVVPMEDINLHFTGDFHAIGAANNLLAAMIDNHIFQGNALNIDPRKITWRRCVDMNDRQLRNVVDGLGGRTNGMPREDGYDITVASEIMAVLCLASDIKDLKERLSRIIIGYTYGKPSEQKPVTAGDLHAEGAMTALLKDALKPNLVQTLEHVPAIVHGGPFANIAHGCNSVTATKMSLKLADYTITEAGFGADLGAEKFLDIKCRMAGLKPNAVVIVATVRALKYNGGVPKADLNNENLEALEKGLPNLLKHVSNIKNVYKLPCVVAINAFPTDTKAELDLVEAKCKELGVNVALSEVWAKGGEGGIKLAEEVIRLVEEPNDFTYSYELEGSIEDKLNQIVQKIYGGKRVVLTANAQKQAKQLEELGFGNCPICVAKTQYSLTDDQTKLGAPTDFEVTVRNLKISAGAADHKVYVAADITTSGKMMAPAGEMTYEAAFEMYQEQIGILKDSGVDLIVAETMINIEETLAAVDAASTVCELPIMCTMTVDADGSIFSGGNAIEAAVSLEAAGADAVGVNCSVGPDQLVSVIRNIKENVSIPVIAKPNAGMPFIDDNGNAVYSMKAPDFARHVKALIDAGAGIVGGCCGTTPEYIREVAKMIGR